MMLQKMTLDTLRFLRLLFPLQFTGAGSMVWTMNEFVVKSVWICEENKAKIARSTDKITSS